MSSRSKGVTYCVFRSWMRSWVIWSPSVSIAFTSAWLTEEFGYSRNRVSARRAHSSAFAPERAKRS
jgi:hypothetical protein